MTLPEIKNAIENGLTVHWTGPRYTVIKDRIQNFLIICDNGNCIGLTWQDGITLNGNEKEFYIK